MRVSWWSWFCVFQFLYRAANSCQPIHLGVGYCKAWSLSVCITRLLSIFITRSLCEGSPRPSELKIKLWPLCLSRTIMNTSASHCWQYSKAFRNKFIFRRLRWSRIARGLFDCRPRRVLVFATMKPVLSFWREIKDDILGHRPTLNIPSHHHYSTAGGELPTLKAMHQNSTYAWHATPLVNARTNEDLQLQADRLVSQGTTKKDDWPSVVDRCRKVSNMRTSISQ